MFLLPLALTVLFVPETDTITFANCERMQDYNRGMKCDVTNHTSTALSAIRFDVLARDANRTIPWHSLDDVGNDLFGARISGGLEPEEELNLLIHIPALNERAQDDTLILELHNLRLEGPEGAPVAH